MHLTGSFSCNLCDFVASQKHELVDHKREAHKVIADHDIVLKEKGKFNCKLCDFVANSSQIVIYHMASVHKQGSYLCDQCDFVGAFASELKTHEKKHGNFACDKCNFTTNLKIEMKKHEKYKHGQKNTHPCPKCDYKATRADALRSHISAVHLKTPHPCDMCDHKSFRKGDLRKHVKQKHGTSLQN